MYLGLLKTMDSTHVGRLQTFKKKYSHHTFKICEQIC